MPKERKKPYETRTRLILCQKMFLKLKFLNLIKLITFNDELYKESYRTIDKHKKRAGAELAKLH